MQFFSQVNFFYALPQFPAENDPLQAKRYNSEHSWVVLFDHYNCSLKILLCKGLICLKIYFTFL